MKVCPACRQKQPSEPGSTAAATLEYCPACQVVWLDFGGRRPRFYDRLEARIRHWEAHLAKHSC